MPVPLQCSVVSDGVDHSVTTRKDGAKVLPSMAHLFRSFPRRLVAAVVEAVVAVPQQPPFLCDGVDHISPTGEHLFEAAPTKSHKLRSFPRTLCLQSNARSTPVVAIPPPVTLIYKSLDQRPPF